ncbi:hypothetical protein FACS189418_2750 [Clostridia bacterium]|nr:hypothetical protein FACS189418_2750 [Clostridia bacterium]
MIKQKSLLKFIFYSLITCGIYSFYILHQSVEEINKMCEGDGNSIPDFWKIFLLSVLTCGVYGLVMIYQVAQRLQANAPKYDLCFDDGGGTVLLWMTIGSFCFGIGTIIGWYILFYNFNEMADKYNILHDEENRIQTKNL